MNQPVCHPTLSGPFSSKRCRYCDGPLTEAEAVKTFGYWKGYQFWSHAACKDLGYKQEAIECQSLDRDCNDCRFFLRETMLTKGIWSGRCTNQERTPQAHAQCRGAQVLAFPNFSSGHPCFVHRKCEAR